MAFQQAACGAFREAYAAANPSSSNRSCASQWKPRQNFRARCRHHQSAPRHDLSATEDKNFTAIEAEVPLGEMFGYSTVLRSATQGKAEFTMEFKRYAKVPESIAEELKKAYQEKQKHK